MTSGRVQIRERSSRLNMISKLDWAMRGERKESERGRERKQRRRREEQESPWLK